MISFDNKLSMPNIVYSFATDYVCYQSINPSIASKREFHLLWIFFYEKAVLYKKAIVKSFAIFTGKHLCWSFFLMKLQS